MGRGGSKTQLYCKRSSINRYVLSKSNTLLPRAQVETALAPRPSQGAFVPSPRCHVLCLLGSQLSVRPNTGPPALPVTPSAGSVSSSAPLPAPFRRPPCGGRLPGGTRLRPCRAGVVRTTASGPSGASLSATSPEKRSIKPKTLRPNAPKQLGSNNRPCGSYVSQINSGLQIRHGYNCKKPLIVRQPVWFVI